MSFFVYADDMGGGKGLLMGPHLKDLKGARKHHTHTSGCTQSFSLDFGAMIHVNLPGILQPQNHVGSSWAFKTSASNIFGEAVTQKKLNRFDGIIKANRMGETFDWLTLWMCWIVSRLLWGILLRYDTIPCGMYVWMIFGQEMFRLAFEHAFVITPFVVSAVIVLENASISSLACTPLQLSIAVSWFP